MPMVPKVAFPIVDALKFVNLYVKAITHRKAANHHFIAAKADPFGFQTVAKIPKSRAYKDPRSTHQTIFFKADGLV